LGTTFVIANRYGPASRVRTGAELLVQQIGASKDPNPQAINVELQRPLQSGRERKVVGELHRDVSGANSVLRMSNTAPRRESGGLAPSARPPVEVSDGEVDV